MLRKKKKPMMVEKHEIKETSPFFKLISGFCARSKSLYNQANYIVRQEFINNGKWIRYEALDAILKADTEFPSYRNMPTAQSAQQCLKLLDSNWKDFFAAIKDYMKHKEKYEGKPGLPGYLKQGDMQVLTLTNQNCKLVDNEIRFPKVFQGFTIKTRCRENPLFKKFQQIRIVPHKHRLVVEVVYAINEVPMLESNGRVIGIDIGVDNLATVSNNIGEQAFIINGKPLKSLNQYWNKIVSHYREVAKHMNKLDFTDHMCRLTDNRTARINDYLHKASRFIVNFCLKHDIRTIVIGKNEGWKTSVNMGKKNNQEFVQIPFARFIEMIQYKAKNVGIAVITTEESYTSGTSFIDNEEPTKEFYNKKRRVKRGMFVSNSGIRINADLNGAYQIIKKVFPIKWDSGCVLHPVVVKIA